MKVVGLVATFLGGMAACFLLFLLGVVDRVDGIPGTQEEPILSLPTYLGFLGVMLTAVSVALTALAIGVGLVAAFTFRGIKDEVQSSLDARAVESQKKLDAALNAVEIRASEAMAEVLNALKNDPMGVAMRESQTVAELEETLDPQDRAER